MPSRPASSDATASSIASRGSMNGRTCQNFMARTSSRKPVARVHVDRDAGHAAREIAREEEDRAGDIVRGDDALQRGFVHEIASDLGGGPSLLTRLPIEVDVEARPVDVAGQHGVHADPARTHFESKG